MKRQPLQIILPIVAVAIFGVIAALLIANTKQAEKKPQKETIPFVATQPVQLVATTLKVNSQTTLQPKFKTTLTAQISGEVIFIAADFVPGGFVKSGTVLAKIDPFNYEVSLAQAKASLASARASFILERAQGQVAEAEWKQISSAKPSELGLRKPQQEQALASVKAAEASLKRAEKDLQRTRIVAPFDALIISRDISIGTLVNTGGSLGAVADTHLGELRLPIKQSDFQFLQGNTTDNTVTLVLPTNSTLSQPQWQAHVVRNESIVDTNTGMTHLVAELTDPYNLEGSHFAPLPFGTFVTAEINGKVVNNTFKIQRKWLKNQRLPVLVNDALQYKTVTVLRHSGHQSIIDSGLDDGDLIVTSPLSHPYEGMKLLPTGKKPNTRADAPDAEPDPPGQVSQKKPQEGQQP